MQIFETVFPVLAIALFGYACARGNVFDRAACDAIAALVFRLLMPVLLFVGTAQADIPADMGWSFVYAYYLPALTVYALGAWVAARWFGMNAAEQSVLAMGGAYSNTTIVGVPVTLFALGKDALLPLFILVSVHNLVLFSLGLVVAERSRFAPQKLLHSLWQLGWQFVRNPITGSLIAGLLVNRLQIPLYEPLEKALEMLSQACVPVSLFVLGTLLNKYRIRGNIRPAVTVVVLRMVVMPLLVWWLAFHVFDIPLLWAATALLVASMPVGITAYVYAQQTGACEAPLATAIVLSTLLTILALPVVLGYLRTLPLPAT